MLQAKNLVYTDGFINGIVRLASAVSTDMGPSGMAAVVARSATAAACELSGVDAESIKTHEANQSLKELMSELLDGFSKADGLTDSLMHLIECEIGEASAVLRFDNDWVLRKAMSGYSGGEGPFYFTEDLFVGVFPEVEVLFIVGNDE